MWLKALERLTWTLCSGQHTVFKVELEIQLNICCFVLTVNTYPLFISMVFALLPCGLQVLSSTSCWRLSWDHIVVVTTLTDFTFLLGLLVRVCLLRVPFVTESDC